MDLIKVIEELRREKEKLERVSGSLEELQATLGAAAPEQKRRGRKSMTLSERQEVSERIKRYWARRRTSR
jgi:hypothetical protein